MIQFLLVGAVMFGILAAMLPDPKVKRISLVLFAVCAATFVVLALLPMIGAVHP